MWLHYYNATTLYGYHATFYLKYALLFSTLTFLDCVSREYEIAFSLGADPSTC